MKTLVISKPIYNYYLPLVDFPNNGDVFNIETSIDSIYGEANIAAYMLGKYGVDVSYTGIIGKDEAGESFKKIMEENHVDTKFMEINYDLKTDVAYSIVKTEKGGFSKVKVNTMKNDLTKYKYDFTPDFIVFDDKDFSGANAALNNYPNVTSIFYGDKPTKDALNMCKRSSYVVCNIEFVSKITGLQIELNKPKTVINLYQKLVDLYKCNWIITLGEYGVIYCNDNNVKMIPGIPTTVVDKDKAGSIFFGTFAYCIVSGMDIEESVRLANIGASNSLGVIGAMNGIMDLNALLTYRVKQEVVQEQVVSTQAQSVSTNTSEVVTNPQVEVMNNLVEQKVESIEHVEALQPTNVNISNNEAIEQMEVIQSNVVPNQNVQVNVVNNGTLQQTEATQLNNVVNQNPQVVNNNEVQ